MKTTMDRAGRLVIPKKIRSEAGLTPGMPLDVRCNNGRVEIEPAPVPVKLVRKGRWLVAVPTKKVPRLSAEAVQKVIDEIRNERGL